MDFLEKFKQFSNEKINTITKDSIPKNTGLNTTFFGSINRKYNYHGKGEYNYRVNKGMDLNGFKQNEQITNLDLNDINLNNIKYELVKRPIVKFS